MWSVVWPSLPIDPKKAGEGPLCVNFAISLLTKYWVRNYNCCRYINSKWVLTASFASLPLPP